MCDHVLLFHQFDNSSISGKPVSVKAESADNVKENDDLPKIVMEVADYVELSDALGDVELGNDSANDMKVTVETKVNIHSSTDVKGNVGSKDGVEVIVDNTKVSGFMPY